MIFGTFLRVHLYQTKNSMVGYIQAGSCKIHSERGHPHIDMDFMLRLLPKLLEVRTKIDILTMTFLFTHELRNVGGPRPRHTWPMPKNGPD